MGRYTKDPRLEPRPFTGYHVQDVGGWFRLGRFLGDIGFIALVTVFVVVGVSVVEWLLPWLPWLQ